MAPRTSGETTLSERRHLFERRSPIPRRAAVDRRRRQRRELNLRVARNRRRGIDRRRAERRILADRRGAATRRQRQRTRLRSTPTPFTAEHIAVIRKSFSEPSGSPACPACGAAFTLGRERRRGSDRLRQVTCTGCGKTAVVTNSAMCRVMVIAQQVETRDALRAILASAHHEVVEAADSGVGLAAYREQPADVVLVDVHASGRTSAAQFLRQLRRDFPDARVVAMSPRTSYGVADPLAMMKQLGAAATVRVPCSSAEILRVLEDARR